MNWDAISAVAEMCGSIAVLLTLIYLVVQIKQQNKVTQAQIHQQRADSVAQVAPHFYPPENFELALKVLQDRTLTPERLSGAELLRLQLLLSPLRANLENTFQQYRNGFLSRELYEEVSVPLFTKFGDLLMRFEMPLTKRFRAELSRILEKDPDTHWIPDQS